MTEIDRMALMWLSGMRGVWCHGALERHGGWMSVSRAWKVPASLERRSRSDGKRDWSRSHKFARNPYNCEAKSAEELYRYKNRQYENHVKFVDGILGRGSEVCEGLLRGDFGSLRTCFDLELTCYHGSGGLNG